MAVGRAASANNDDVIFDSFGIVIQAFTNPADLLLVVIYHDVYTHILLYYKRVNSSDGKKVESSVQGLATEIQIQLESSQWETVGMHIYIAIMGNWQYVSTLVFLASCVSESVLNFALTKVLYLP